MLYIEHQALAAPDLYNQLTHQTHQTHQTLLTAVCFVAPISAITVTVTLKAPGQTLPIGTLKLCTETVPWRVCICVCIRVHVFKSKSTSPHNTHTNLLQPSGFQQFNKNLWIACIHTLYRSHNEVLTAAGCRATSGAPCPVVLVATIKAVLGSVAAVS